MQTYDMLVVRTGKKIRRTFNSTHLSEVLEISTIEKRLLNSSNPLNPSLTLMGKFYLLNKWNILGNGEFIYTLNAEQAMEV